MKMLTCREQKTKTSLSRLSEPRGTLHLGVSFPNPLAPKAYAKKAANFTGGFEKCNSLCPIGVHKDGYLMYTSDLVWGSSRMQVDPKQEEAQQEVRCDAQHEFQHEFQPEIQDVDMDDVDLEMVDVDGLNDDIDSMDFASQTDQFLDSLGDIGTSQLPQSSSTFYLDSSPAQVPQYSSRAFYGNRPLANLFVPEPAQPPLPYSGNFVGDDLPDYDDLSDFGEHQHLQNEASSHRKSQTKAWRDHTWDDIPATQIHPSQHRYVEQAKAFDENSVVQNAYEREILGHRIKMQEAKLRRDGFNGCTLTSLAQLPDYPWQYEQRPSTEIPSASEYELRNPRPTDNVEMHEDIYRQMLTNAPGMFEGLIGKTLQEGLPVEELLMHPDIDTKKVLGYKKWIPHQERFDDIQYHYLRNLDCTPHCKEYFHGPPGGMTVRFNEEFTKIREQEEHAIHIRRAVFTWLRAPGRHETFRKILRKAGFCPEEEADPLRDLMADIWTNTKSAVYGMRTLSEAIMSRYPRFFAATVKAGHVNYDLNDCY